MLDRGGYMLIECRDGETGPNPYRTGRICGVTEEGMRRFVDPAKWDQIKNDHIAFMDQTTFKAAGLDKILKEQKELAKT